MQITTLFCQKYNKNKIIVWKFSKKKLRQIV